MTDSTDMFAITVICVSTLIILMMLRKDLKK